MPIHTYNVEVGLHCDLKWKAAYGSVAGCIASGALNIGYTRSLLHLELILHQDPVRLEHQSPPSQIGKTPHDSGAKAPFLLASLLCSASKCLAFKPHPKPPTYVA